MVAQFEAVTPNIKVEIVPIDFNNAPQIIKTGIASGNPVDVSFFWGSAMKTFVDDDMALDLTPYLMANNKEWYNTFVPVLIDAGLFEGKYYAVSYQPVIETMFVNLDIFNEYNLEIPETVDEMLEVCAVLKEHDIYGIGTWNGMFHQMLPWTYQIWANNGVLKEASEGRLPFAGPNETPGLRQNLEMLKYVYEQGYWYPGEGALTATQDQVQAAWYQGKIAMHFDANSDAGKYSTEAPFEVGAMAYPLVEKGGAYGVNVITNALFIPANAAHKEEGIEFMKFYTSPAGQAITNASGRPPSTIAMQEAVENPLVRAILGFTRRPDAVGYTHLQNISSEINTYIGTMISAVCSGESVDEILAGLEDLRLQALND
jgi:ABC-type glycerol-3-phosphate transport system substrate-binding protein